MFVLATKKEARTNCNDKLLYYPAPCPAPGGMDSLTLFKGLQFLFSLTPLSVYQCIQALATDFFSSVYLLLYKWNY